MSQKIRIIKKYQNRKLYDTQDSCYVTLDGIAKMIREGEEIAVVDNNSKEDVTALILTQVLYEQEKTNQSVLPVSILKHIIRCGSNNLFEFMQRYILGAVDAHLQVQNDLRHHVEKLTKNGDLTIEESNRLLDHVRQLNQSMNSSLDRKIEEQLAQKLAQIPSPSTPRVNVAAMEPNPTAQSLGSS